jgi:hypothetical protein
MSATVQAFALFTLLSSVQTTEMPALPASVRPGQVVQVVDDAGAGIEGRVQQVSDQAIRLATRRGITDVPVGSIVRIVRPDGIRNGALIGLAVGVGLGVFSASTFADGDAALMLTQTLGNGVVCAGIGALLDAAVDSRRTLYQRGPRRQSRVTPLIGRGSAGVATSIRW